MKRTLVISDIHGELNLFNELLEKVNYDKDKDQLILLGDYIDRGPYSKQVIERVRSLREDGAITLIGNHEVMLLETVEGNEYGRERYRKNGGLQTVQSYDNSIIDFRLPDVPEFYDHVEFIRSLDLYYETDEYIFVHAGVVPGKTLEESTRDELVWIRDKFFNEYTGNKTVIFGHTPTSRIRGEKDNAPYFGENNIIGIDGGAVFGQQLNCLILPDKTYEYVENKSF
ncbi:metallophosphoesterase family protein [Phocicoccus pinnipedialis]|uniref:Serine/threonine-protein phosphatase 1 n=1 Tax=Phocicoccus pinnipedialis TaxID=110845 RepID=A0A6V7RCC5_9BACL|nr:metallophosphoesterase family protein [Jeotgalicoccus pinnipedialis]MBP1939880.1 serine/threonine protein phosphatase 1 [Jeotgalicoccus pinnipedialis]CAD2074688.1 Serine/threonine-protein phosphatase 1 [Jeotgalicoccus pinnipedialis]